ncbi:hypothetical protein JCM9140_461 [Halalkalibacter wakoensis JCM 9140]|uniref:Uncharacterized protein n=1 Tax=Halalkalibacter wakoensis JCM 9140 TaxID=1236970 RepID=W4PXX3_9BACI|nr:hypothetical protein [Halalkalibacter wakoensis]GAE24525.1 hypothetical protein JCM9140_461 [Halalkalibacter wakoensis JCM 9140]
MESEEYIEDCIYRAQHVIDRALTELMEVKMIRENDPTEYAFVQKELGEIQDEVDKLVDEGRHHERLKDTQKRLNEVREIMIRGI